MHHSTKDTHANTPAVIPAVVDSSRCLLLVKSPDGSGGVFVEAQVTLLGLAETARTPQVRVVTCAGLGSNLQLARGTTSALLASMIYAEAHNYVFVPKGDTFTQSVLSDLNCSAVSQTAFACIGTVTITEKRNSCQRIASMLAKQYVLPSIMHCPFEHMLAVGTH